MVSRQTELKDVPIRKPNDKETLIMDPIHGFIDITQYPVIKEIIETPYFQRLRRLHQLGLVSSIYPNATHSRFAHSIGVMHVFLKLFDSVTRRSNFKKKRIEQLRPVGAVAALLHDIGHGPFSHASEDILEKGKFDHEEMTRKIIMNTKISKILKRNKINPKTILDILKKTAVGDLRLLSQLISSQLDADRLDYLMRDSFFTGVNYGKIEIERIANTIKVWEKNTPNGFKGTFVISFKGLSAIEDYILGRYLMYRGVYFHHVSRCMEQFLIKIFERASKIKEGNKSLSKIINIKKIVTPEKLLLLDDYVFYSLIHGWLKARDKILRDFSNRIINRNVLGYTQVNTNVFAKKIIDNHTALKKIFKGQPFDANYYMIEDFVERSPYDIYRVRDADDEKTPISHIMVEKEGKLYEISELSDVIATLSDENRAKIVTLFYPREFRQKVKDVVFK